MSGYPRRRSAACQLWPGEKAFREYLLRSSQPVEFRFEGVSYKAAIQDVKLFPQGYSAIAVHPELIQGEPSVLLMDIGVWTLSHFV